MNIEIERTQDGQFVAVADLSQRIVKQEPVFRIPIQEREHVEKRFSAELCGFQAESEQVESMPVLLKHLLGGLINVGRLPNYAFVARRAQRVYPVYTIRDEVMATTPGGPVFRHVELAKVREYLTDYLHDTRILGKDGKSDKLHVRGINRHSLALRRPQFYLKKRNPGEQDFWAPVFENGVEDGFYTYAADQRRDAQKENGLGVLRLRSLVAELLATQNRLSDKFDLRADRLQPAVWRELKLNLRPSEAIQVGAHSLETYTYGNEVIAVEERKSEDRFGLYVGNSAENVRQRAERDFTRRGKV